MSNRGLFDKNLSNAGVGYLRSLTLLNYVGLTLSVVGAAAMIAVTWRLLHDVQGFLR